MEVGREENPYLPPVDLKRPKVPNRKDVPARPHRYAPVCPGPWAHHRWSLDWGRPLAPTHPSEHGSASEARALITHYCVYSSPLAWPPRWLKPDRIWRCSLAGKEEEVPLTVCSLDDDPRCSDATVSVCVCILSMGKLLRSETSTSHWLSAI